MNKNIIIAILIVVIIAIVGAFILTQHQATSQDGKINTEVNFLSQTTLKNGDQVEFEIKDAQGNQVTGQNVTISYDESGNIQKYAITTDQNGKGYLTISGEDSGQYNVTVDYNGSDKYNGCIGHQTITIEDGTSNAEETISEQSTANTVMYNNNTNSSSTQSSNDTSGSSSSSGASQSTSQSYYDGELNVYYDSNGKVIGGQEAGASIYDLRERMNDPNIISEDGSLQ